MTQHLDGRVAVVTGAARGIGAAVAERLAKDGATVAVYDLDVDSTADVVGRIVAAGGRATGFACDVANEQAVKSTFEQVNSQLGPVTVLVNNAGILRDNLLFKMSVDDWDAVMNVHLRGHFLASREAQKSMVEQKWGKIVNLSS